MAPLRAKERIQSSQIAVLQIFIQGAMDLIPAAFDDCVKNSSVGAAKLASVIILQQGKFRQQIHSKPCREAR